MEKLENNSPLDEKNERRKDPRLKVKIWAEEKVQEGEYFHLLSNISSGGFFIEKKLPFSIGETVKLEIKLPTQNESIKINGQVVNNYQDPNSNFLGAGVKFIDIDQNTKDKIIGYLESLKING